MKRILTPVLFTALFAGTLDIAAAMVNYSVSTGNVSTAVLRFIASGVFGSEAFSGGMMMAACGLIFHYCIAFFWTMVYFLLYPHIQSVGSNAYLAGAFYGVIIWCGMNLIVLPCSNVPHHPIDAANAAEAIAILIICIGIPVAVIAHRFYSMQKKQ
ncbi:MAG: DUF1440 domain-containing protein [Bacteroidota bacterium]|jgi:hypothetical protein